MSAPSEADAALLPQLPPLMPPQLPPLMPAPLKRLLESRLDRVIQREPDSGDTSRWRQWQLGDRNWQVAQPVTFTPYASARPCSARCRFCSETLADGGAHAAGLRPGTDYFDRLRSALVALRGLPLSYSLSGLETTDDAAWMLGMLDALQEHADRSPVQASVLYSNGAGFAGSAGGRLMERLQGFGLDWIELSRHHFEAGANQAIMRFRDGQPIAGQACFEGTLAQLSRKLAVKLVCIVQQGGVADLAALKAYLAWAAGQGVGAVIFREFSQLGPGYRENVTSRYIASARVAMDGLLAACLADAEFTAQSRLRHATSGYYFWNVVLSFRGMEITFEASDYARMHERHDSGRVYKLVFHANGNLCGGWDPRRNVLLGAQAPVTRVALSRAPRPADESARP